MSWEPVALMALSLAIVALMRRLARCEPEPELEVEPDRYEGLPRSYPEYVDQLYGKRR